MQRASQFLTGLVPRMQQLLGSSSAVSNAAMSSAVGFAPNAAADYLPRECSGEAAVEMSELSGLDMRILALMDELRSDNEIRQSEACGELSEMLLLGNEESLPNFPIRELILCLVALLNKDHNFELVCSSFYPCYTHSLLQMLSASRCITNLQEALPRSHSVLVEAVPVLLQKLKRIEYIDVAEQSLVILEVISRRNAKNILSASGVQAVISHVDFFSMPTQRLAFQIAANCASYVTPNEFHLAQDCLADLTQRLNMDVSGRCARSFNSFALQDKRCVESICSFFNRLIENMRFHPQRLRQIAGKNHELLQVFQQLVSSFFSFRAIDRLSSAGHAAALDQLGHVHQPAQIAPLHVHELRRLECRSLPPGIRPHSPLPTRGIGEEGRPALHRSDQSARPAAARDRRLDRVCSLFFHSCNPRACSELLPKLPSTGLFEVNVYLEQYTNPSAFLQNGRYKVGTTMWVYKDPVTSDRVVDWKPFAPNEQLALERNRSMGVTTMPLEVDGQLCEIDFSTMKRRVIATGAEVEIDRRPFSEYGKRHKSRVIHSCISFSRIEGREGELAGEQRGLLPRIHRCRLPAARGDRLKLDVRESALRLRARDAANGLRGGGEGETALFPPRHPAGRLHLVHALQQQESRPDRPGHSAGGRVGREVARLVHAALRSRRFVSFGFLLLICAVQECSSN